jgi:hypothetical protein
MPLRISERLAANAGGITTRLTKVPSGLSEGFIEIKFSVISVFVATTFTVLAYTPALSFGSTSTSILVGSIGNCLSVVIVTLYTYFLSCHRLPQKRTIALMPTNIPLPNGHYVSMLGEVAYSVGYLEWLILGDLGRVPDLPPGIDLQMLARKTTKQIGDALMKAAKFKALSQADREWLAEGGKQLVAISKKRNDILHARPATTSAGEECLYRWTAQTGKQFWIDSDYLTKFLFEVGSAVSVINAKRPKVSISYYCS